mgnify:CR=1 FL=1
MLSLPGVDYVEFYVNGIPYMIGEVPVGMMKAEDFIDNTSDEEFYTQVANVSVYFANEDGTALRESHRQVSYITFLQFPVNAYLHLVHIRQLHQGINDRVQYNRLINSLGLIKELSSKIKITNPLKSGCGRRKGEDGKTSTGFADAFLSFRDSCGER